MYLLDGVVKEAEGEKCFMEEPITFAQMYSRKMSRHIEVARQKKLAKLAEQTLSTDLPKDAKIN